jgi:hypothetical protein
MPVLISRVKDGSLISNHVPSPSHVAARTEAHIEEDAPAPLGDVAGLADGLLRATIGPWLPRPTPKPAPWLQRVRPN